MTKEPYFTAEEIALIKELDIDSEGKKLLKAVAEENNAKPREFLEAMKKKREHVRRMTTSKNGKYKVICVDKFSNEDCLVAEFTDPITAVEFAEQQTKDAMKDTTDASIATVYYAYTPSGEYLGGDAWEKVKKK